MGKFSDAVKASNKSIQSSPDFGFSERLKTEESQSKRLLRKQWLDTVLDPVLADVNEDVKNLNLKFKANAKEDNYSTFVELLFFRGDQSNPTNLTITIAHDGVVKIYILSGLGIEIGTTGKPDRKLLEDQLVNFLTRHVIID